ncbi:MAG TPA: hypothetical protein VGP08_10575 [Pyrinomonadaceae bacterium]|jgi:hypothetical protein|nr:hypothetical protein [Pyrinomonadaceae bacterium]
MRIIGAIILLLCVTASASADLKITRKAGAGGYSGQSTVYVKGARERTEMPTITSIRQCDLRRTIQINERARKYAIVPDSEVGAATTHAPAPAAPQGPKTTRRGAVVTHTVNINDTGERKQMFGYTARHIKTTMVMDAPAEACSPGHMEMESDGWYIDFAAGGPSCDVDRPTPPPTRSARPDCADQIRYKTTGSGRLGFPVMVTTKMKMGGAQGGDEEDAEVAAAMSNAMTSTIEVTEISTVTLDPALFDVPAGYAQAASVEELYSSSGMMGTGGMPGGGTTPGARAPSDTGQSMGAMNSSAMSAMSAARPKQPGMIRVGVAGIGNSAGGSVSLGTLRATLVGSISDSNVEAVALDASEPSAADAEAKTKECDFVLYTDLSALKQSAASKVGGMFGRVTGVGGLQKYESRVDFRLVPAGGSAPSLESNAAAKEDGADASVSAALQREAKAVTAAARKKK